MRFNRLVCATALATVGLSAVALAEPAREATLTAAAPSYTWEATNTGIGSDVGNPFQIVGAQIGEECFEQGFPCDDTLLKVDDLGTLEVVSDADDGVDANTRPDMDLYLYESDASGTPGKLLKASETPEPDERLTQKISKAGFYLIRNKWFSGVDVTYKGSALLKGASTAAPGPVTPATPASPATPAAPAALTASVAFGAAKLSKVGKTGFAVKVSCSAACKGSFALAISKRDAKKLKIKGGKLGKASFDHAGDKVVVVKVSKAVAKKLKKAKSATVELKGAATDASGGQQTALAAKAKFKK